ncbi:hypothetical protein [Limnoglobus roseus]|uniref:hypothetical protein n=1 Tax=Limnoglobus roseus TaxID=2598579 RepID=UPI0011EA74B0|nr:hypothetical protein [Limnoglobus roseus]
MSVSCRQIIADTNPDRPTHWLKKRCDRGQTRLIESRHEDNPSVIDPKTGKPTPDGAVYLAKLDALTGPRKPRLRYGLWVQAEGVVYEGWDPHVHLVDRFDIPHDWPRFLSIDFGYTNPFSCGWYARDPDGRLFLYREIYMTRRTVAAHAETILKCVGAWDAGRRCANWFYATEPTPALVICDHDAEDRATLEGVLLLGTVPADKAITAGIQAVSERLVVQPDGKARLYVLRDSLVERDAELDRAGHPCSIVDEFSAYMWPKTNDGRAVKEVPVDLHNHAMDQMRYIVQTLATRGFVQLTPDSVSVGGGTIAAQLQRAGGSVHPDDEDDDGDTGGSMFGNLFGRV